MGYKKTIYYSDKESGLIAIDLLERAERFLNQKNFKQKEYELEACGNDCIVINILNRNVYSKKKYSRIYVIDEEYCTEEKFPAIVKTILRMMAGNSGIKKDFPRYVEGTNVFYQNSNSDKYFVGCLAETILDPESKAELWYGGASDCGGADGDTEFYENVFAIYK